jgi:hypothetical protein
MFAKTRPYFKLMNKIILIIILILATSRNLYGQVQKDSAAKVTPIIQQQNDLSKAAINLRIAADNYGRSEGMAIFGIGLGMIGSLIFSSSPTAGKFLVLGGAGIAGISFVMRNKGHSSLRKAGFHLENYSKSHP